MQLDRTTIVIRERGLLDILDLSLFVLRRYFVPLAVLFALAIVPLMLVNHLLVGWLIGPDATAGMFARYLWLMLLLVVIEAPLVSVFATSYLGQAVFLERPSLRSVLGDVCRVSPRLLVTQGLLRGIVPAALLTLVIDRYSNVNVTVEIFLIPLIALYAIGLRAFRPYLNEIVLLERHPLRSADRTVPSIARRSSQLHGFSAGLLLARWMGTVPLAVLLFFSLWGALRFLPGALLNDWSYGPLGGPLLRPIVYPLAMWLVAAYLSIVRFLSYLDLRIRDEGWEVELLLRAEAGNLLQKPT